MPADSTQPDQPEQDDLHKNFRAALERKKNASHHSEDHLDRHGAGPAQNDKTKRQFRRKSGG